MLNSTAMFTRSVLERKYPFWENLVQNIKVANLKHDTYNHFHNILKLFDVLPTFLFTTSETMRDHYLQAYLRFTS